MLAAGGSLEAAMGEGELKAKLTAGGGAVCGSKRGLLSGLSGHGGPCKIGIDRAGEGRVAT